MILLILITTRFYFPIYQQDQLQYIYDPSTLVWIIKMVQEYFITYFLSILYVLLFFKADVSTVYVLVEGLT